MRRTVIVTRTQTTLVVRVGRYTESFDTAFLSVEEVVEHTYYVLVTASTPLSRETIIDLLVQAGVL